MKETTRMALYLLKTTGRFLFLVLVCQALFYPIRIARAQVDLAKADLTQKDTDSLPDTRQALVRALIIPVLETTLSSAIPGLIQEIRVDFGSSFVKNQVLVVFDCGSYRGELEKAAAEYEQAKTILEVNQRLERMQSVSDVEIAVAEGRLKMSRAEKSLRQIDVNRCVLKAPFAGRVLKREATPFEYATPGQPLLQVIADKELRLQMFVPSVWLAHISPGTAFTVHIDETQKTYSAEIETLGARVDPVSQTLEIRAVIQGNHPELLAGMSGSAQFTDR